MPRIPENIHRHLLAAQRACDALGRISSEKGCPREFTLDGRFVGDVGELIASQYFDIESHRVQKRCHDGTCRIRDEDIGVQIKCRRKSTVIDFTSQPKLLLVITIDDSWQNWEVVYNGPGDFLTGDKDFTADAEGRLFRGGKKKGRRVYIDELRDRDAKLSDGAPRVPERAQG